MNSGKRLAICFLSRSLILSGLIPSISRTRASASTVPTTENRTALHEGWSLQTSAKVEAKGEVISTPQFILQRDGMKRPVPTTVVAALVKDKTLPDPLFGMNLRELSPE